MNEARLRRLRNDLSGLVEQRRRQRELVRPCPECGRAAAASGPSIQWVDRETGLDTVTGAPPCGACAALAEKHFPGRVHRIDLTPVDGPDSDTVA